jgi:hypothetical protein
MDFWDDWRCHYVILVLEYEGKHGSASKARQLESSSVS